MMTPPSQTPILLIGATGYIGGSVLARLLAHPNVSAFEITVITRSPEKAKALESLGVRAVVGSTSEEKKLEALAEQAHIIFSCADADDLQAVNAILHGLKRRFDTFGDRPILIHTSGTGVLSSLAGGMFPTDTIYDDLNSTQIESLAPTQPHRDVDLTIVDADRQGYVSTFIVLPSTIYGIASNPLVAASIQNPYSQQIPKLIRVSLARGQGGMVGKGLSMWPNVHIDDVADLYIVLFNAALSKTDTIGHGREGFYFGENGEHTWYNISKAISKGLVDTGRGKSEEPTTFTEDELVKYWGSVRAGNSYGTNSRCRANHSRSVGWSPKKTTANMLASVKPEVEAIIRAGA